MNYKFTDMVCARAGIQGEGYSLTELLLVGDLHYYSMHAFVGCV
jgi:hypothetical protein